MQILNIIGSCFNFIGKVFQIIFIGLSMLLNITPFGRGFAIERAKSYVNKYYAEMNYEVENVKYSYYDNTYVVYFHSPTNIDGDFYLRIGEFGNIEYNSYYMVEERYNTSSRINDQYEEFMKNVAFENSQVAYLEGIDYTLYAHLWNGDWNEYPKGALLRNDLELNKTDYDVRALGEVQGRIMVFIKNVEPTYENVADILLETKMIAEENNAPFYVLTLVFKQGGGWDEWELQDFPYADIYEEDLVKRVKIFHEDGLETNS